MLFLRFDFRCATGMVLGLRVRRFMLIAHAESYLQEYSSGLAICQYKPYLAASPNAVVEVGNRIVGVVEIKCP